MKEKKIDEMAKHCHFYEEGKCLLLEDEAVECDTKCDMCEFAKRLYNAGYRKESDVAREIERYLRLNEDIAIRCKAENGEQNEEYWKGKLSAFRQIRGFIDAELKKKYTESENDNG